MGIKARKVHADRHRRDGRKDRDPISADRRQNEPNTAASIYRVAAPASFFMPAAG